MSTAHTYGILIAPPGVSRGYPETMTIGGVRIRFLQLPLSRTDAYRMAGLQFCRLFWPPAFRLPADEADGWNVSAYLQSRVRTPLSTHPEGSDSCPDLDLRYFV